MFKLSGRKIIYLQIIYNLIVKFLINELHMPHFLNYFTDYLNMILIILILQNFTGKLKKIKEIRIQLIIIILYFIVTFVGLIIYRQPILLYIWALRNTFRFYVFFFGCVIFLKKEDITSMIHMLISLSFLNIIFCFFQWKVMGLQQDYLGGIFGSVIGMNGYLNVFLVIVLTIIIIEYSYNNLSIKTLILEFISLVLIAAVAEMKFFFIEFIIIILLYILLTQKNYKVFIYLIVGGILIYFGIQKFYELFPNWDNFFTFEKILKSSKSYSTADDLGRLTALDKIKTLFLDDNGLRLLFGIGFGNAETSSIKMFESSFYNRYSYLHYIWLSDAWIFLETGYLGLIFNIGFYFSIFVKCFNKKLKTINKSFVYTGQIISFICIVLTFYNSSLRTEAGYFMFYFLSIPFIIDNKNI